MANEERPDVIHGRLMEALHIGGYELTRGLENLDALLDGDKWKELGNGFDDVDVFIDSLKLSTFKYTIEQRQNIVKKLGAIRGATQRAIAQAVGVGVATVNRDINPVPNGTKAKEGGKQKQDVGGVAVPNGTKSTAITQSGEDVARAAAKVAERQAKVAERQTERIGLVATMPSGKYAVILADPPWQYSNSGFDQSAESQYPTMATEDICKMAGIVNDFSTPETVLFMWATNPLLPDALKVLAAWGYEYKTNMAWIKDMGRGKGWFLKSRHELLLIGTRENTPHPKERPDSCFEADRGPVHSRKPQVVYDIIESMYDGAKLEMFCRTLKEGWASHGNEL